MVVKISFWYLETRELSPTAFMKRENSRAIINVNETCKLFDSIIFWIHSLAHSYRAVIREFMNDAKKAKTAPKSPEESMVSHCRYSIETIIQGA